MPNLVIIYNTWSSQFQGVFKLKLIMIVYSKNYTIEFLMRSMTNISD